MKKHSFDVAINFGGQIITVGPWTDGHPYTESESPSLRSARAEMDRYKSNERALRRLVDGKVVEVMEHKQAE